MVAVGACARRRRRRAAEHAAAAARARGPAPHRGGRRTSWSCPTFRGRDYLDDLALHRRGPRARDRAVRRRRCPRLRSIAVWDADRRVPTDDGVDRRRRSTRSTRRSGRPTTSRSCSPRAAGAAEGRDPHPRRRAARRPRPGSTSRRIGARRPALHPDAVLLDGRLRRPACSRCSSPGPRCSPRRRPSPARTLALLERERVTLFRGWPDQAARARRATSASPPPTSSSLRPGSLAAVLPAERRVPARAAGEPVRHDRDVRPVLRRPPRRRPARRARRAAAAGRSPAIEVRIVDPDTGTRRSRPASSARSSCAARTSCAGSAAAPRADVFDRRRLLPDRRPRSRSTPTATSGTPAGSTTCSR